MKVTKVVNPFFLGIIFFLVDITAWSEPNAENSSFQNLIEVENLRRVGDSRLLNALKFSDSKRITRQAILAAGRIPDPAAIEELSKFVTKKDMELRKLAIFSLGAMGHPVAFSVLTQNLVMIRDSETKAWILRAIGISGQHAGINAAQSFLNTDSADQVIHAACLAIGNLMSLKAALHWEVSKKVLEDLLALSTHPKPYAVAAAWALSRFQGPKETLPHGPLLEGIQKTALTDLKLAFLIKTIGPIQSEASTAKLLEIYKPTLPYALKLSLTTSYQYAAASDALWNVTLATLHDTSSRVVVQSLYALSERKTLPESILSELYQLIGSHPSAWVRGEALLLYGKHNFEKTKPLLRKVFKNSKSPEFPFAIQALRYLGHPSDFKQLLSLATNAEGANLVASLKAIKEWPTNKLTSDFEKEVAALLPSTNPAMIAELAEISVQHQWTKLMSTLVDEFSKLPTQEFLEAKLAILKGIAELKLKKYSELAINSLSDNQPLIANQAKDTLITLGEKLPENIKHNPPTWTTPSYESWNQTLQRSYQIKTTQGTIGIQTLSQSPLTNYHFHQLVQSGKYRGTKFHRIVPGFVAQGGDPTGTGYGGSATLIRDEVSQLDHEAGTLGIATAGKDSGDSQFFFNLADNYHLNGRYTVFAKVTSNLEVIYRLEPHDEILEIR